jgi:hypothetical protein
MEKISETLKKAHLNHVLILFLKIFMSFNFTLNIEPESTLFKTFFEEK